MTFTKAIDKTTGEPFKVLISNKAINADQMKLVQEIIAFFDAKEDATDEDKERYAKREYKRIEMAMAHKALRSRECAPYWITKNKASNHGGSIHLNVFKLRAEKKAAAAPKLEDAPAPKKSGRKGAKTAPAATTPVTDNTAAAVGDVL